MIWTLLLLAALTGPLCEVTWASTIAVPTSPPSGATASTAPTFPASTQTSKEEITKMITEIASKGVSDPLTEDPTERSTVGPTNMESSTKESSTLSFMMVSNSAKGPASTKEPHSLTHSTAALKTVVGEDRDFTPTVFVEETEGALTTGQVVGIAVGALLALALVVAVAAMAVRRMGQYSP